MLRRLTGFAVVLACCAMPMAAEAQGDGPRAYYPLPIDTNVLVGIGMFSDGNKSVDSAIVIPEGNIDMGLGVLQYTRSFKVGSKTAAFMMFVPAGEVTGGFQIGEMGRETTSSGVADIGFGMIMGLVNAPALTWEEYAEAKTGYTMGAQLRIYAPVGSYDSSQILNMGTNRWAVQVLAPMGWYLGKSFMDPAMTTIEFVPSLTFYGDNTDVFGDVERLEQAPLLRLESHITRNLNRALWISLDSMYHYGARATTDGVSDDEAQSAFSLGGSVGMFLSRSLSVQATYGGYVAHNDAGPDGTMFRFKVMAIF